MLLAAQRRYVPNIGVFVSHSDHDSLMAGAADDRAMRSFMLVQGSIELQDPAAYGNTARGASSPVDYLDGYTEFQGSKGHLPATIGRYEQEFRK